MVELTLLKKMREALTLGNEISEIKAKVGEALGVGTYVLCDKSRSGPHEYWVLNVREGPGKKLEVSLKQAKMLSVPADSAGRG